MKVNFVARIPGQHQEFHKTELDILPRPGDFVQTPKGEGTVHSITFLVADDPEDHEVAVLVNMQGLN